MSGGNRAVFDKIGKPPDAMKAVDAGGDGKPCPEEETKGPTAAGANPEEAQETLKDMGKVRGG